MRYLFRKNVRETSNCWKRLKKSLATLLAITSQPSRKNSKLVGAISLARMSLHGASGGRKYLNNSERRRFLLAIESMPAKVRLFCQFLVWSGCRLSEALAITPDAIDIDAGLVSIHSLKKRRQGIVRQVPLPPQLLYELNSVFELRTSQCDPKLAARLLWPWSRSTGWRYVKKAMQLAAIAGSNAMPKGLRHAFGVAAFSTVPPHIVQRWLGHSSLRTTAIYGEVSGPEEKLFAKRLWRRH